MSRIPFMMPSDAAMVLSLLDYAERSAPQSPCAFLRGLCVGITMAPAAARQDPRREPERHDTEPSLATPVAKIPLVQKESHR